MKPIHILTAAALLGLLAFPVLAQDTANDDICYKRAQEVCGKSSMTECFQDDAKWQDVGPECEGAIQQLVEGERDSAANMGDHVSAEGMMGLSYGGILRKGPSMQSAKLASMKKGDKFDIIEDTGVVTDGYTWFKIRTAHGIGYHWGGIFCIPGDDLPQGVFDNCQLMDQ